MFRDLFRRCQDEIGNIEVLIHVLDRPHWQALAPSTPLSKIVAVASADDLEGIFVATMNTRFRRCGNPYSAAFTTRHSTM